MAEDGILTSISRVQAVKLKYSFTYQAQGVAWFTRHLAQQHGAALEWAAPIETVSRIDFPIQLLASTACAGSMICAWSGSSCCGLASLPSSIFFSGSAIWTSLTSGNVSGALASA